MEYLMFPGCKVLVSDPDFEHSSHLVLKKLGVILLPENNFCCCGPTLLSSIDQKSGLVLNARNICLGEEKSKNIFTLCSWCFKTLNETNNRLKISQEFKNNVNSVLKDVGKEFKGTIEIKNLIQILLDDIGLENIEAHIIHKLNFLKVASFMGCHLRGGPKDIFDTTFISDLDKIINVTQAQNVSFKEKFFCCGGLVCSLSELETKFNYNIIQRLTELNLDALVVACPYCFERFNKVLNSIKEKISLDIIYLSDLIGLAMGLSPKELALDQRENKPTTILKKLNESK